MQTFQLFGQQVSVLECMGFAFGVIGVWLTIKQNIWCFPVGIINVAIYSFIFFKMMWHANALLQLSYIGILVYGWIHWKNAAANKLAVTATKKHVALLLIVIGAVTSSLFGYIMKETTNNPLPYWDATTTCMSLIAQWMVAEKKIENWLLWIVADIIYVGMCLYQSLYLTAILYFIYLLLAVKGHLEWKKAMQQTV